MIRLLLAVALVASATSANADAQAGDVVRWTDENGVTQFTDPKFAPTAEVVKIQPANGMEVPEAASQARGKPSFVRINKAAKKNKRGFRGHSGRTVRSRSRSRYR